MSFFHRHNWREQERHFTGTTAITRVTNLDAEQIERLLFGVTTILLRCDCGAFSREEILGDARHPPAQDQRQIAQTYQSGLSNLLGALGKGIQ